MAKVNLTRRDFEVYANRVSRYDRLSAYQLKTLNRYKYLWQQAKTNLVEQESSCPELL